MIRVKALDTSHQIPVVVLLIVALVMYALLGMGTTAQNILRQPSVNNLVRSPQGLGSTVREGAIQIREIAQRQINQPSTIGPTFPRVDANPAAIRQTRSVARSTELELVSPAPAIVPAPVIVTDSSTAKSDKTPAASEHAAQPGKKDAAAGGSSAYSDAGKKDKTNNNGSHRGLTKGPDKRN